MILYYIEKSAAALGIGITGKYLAAIAATSFDMWLQRGVMLATMVGALVPATLAIATWLQNRKRNQQP